MSKNIIKCECCGCHYIESEETDNLCAKCNEYIHKQRQELQELKEWNIKVETEHEEMIQEYDKRIVKLEEENRDLHTAINMSIPNQIAMRDEIDRLRTCRDKRIEELLEQLKELPKKIMERAKQSAEYVYNGHAYFDAIDLKFLEEILEEIKDE